MFRQFCRAATIAFAAGAALPALAQPGVSANLGQPGFYGRIDIGGNVPPPALIYREPVLVEPPHHQVQRAPIYLRVPPGHAKDWSKHCARYNACGQPVYFVQDRWYNEVYAPHHHMASPRGFEPGHGRPHRRERDDDDWQRGRHHDGHRDRERERDDHDRHHGGGRGHD